MKYEFGVGTVSDIIAVGALIPEFKNGLTLERIEARLQGKQNLILVAKYQDKPVGFKVGYELDKTQFYSWLGGVQPSHRKMGVASELRVLQELWAKENGFDSISVKSMNRFPAMLQMLIASGYHISGYEDLGSAEESKIKFLKRLD